MTQYNKISNDLRERLIKALEAGSLRRKDAANVFNISYSSVVRIYNEYLKNGKIQKKIQGGKKQKKLQDSEINIIKSWLEENCTLTLKEIKNKIFIEKNISVSLRTISRYIDSFNYSFKRINKISEHSITENLNIKRQQYSELFLRLINSSINLFFFDETGF